MSVEPDTGDSGVPYPNPRESDVHLDDRVDLSDLGYVVFIREWQGKDGLIEQFALMLNIAQSHPSFSRCRAIKGEASDFTRIRRTDTWDSEIHSHQFFIDRVEEEREVHEPLFGGDRLLDSRKKVHAAYHRFYNELVFSPFEYAERWEAGK